MPATTNRVPLGLVGPSSKAYSPAQQSARTVNLIPETNDADAKAVMALRAAPGFFRWADATNLGAATGDEIRGMFTFQNRFFVVCGPKILELQRDLTLNSWSSTTVLGSLATHTGRVGLSYNNGFLIIGDGFFWALNLTTKVLAPVLDDPNGGEQIAGFYSGWLDGTQLYFERDSSKYWYSGINDPLTVTGLSFFSAEFNPDNTLAAHVINGEIHILGERSYEWHWDSGDADNPFQRISGGRREIGVAGRWANCRFGDVVAMVGRTPDGQGRVYLMGPAGSVPQPISSPAVEKALEKVLFALYNVTDDISMWAYEDAGHDCLILNLPKAGATANNPGQPSMTWCWDRSTGLWHERAYSNPATGQFERIRSEFHILYNGRHYTGDYQLANIYEMAHDYFRENTIPLVKFRETPHLYFGGRRFSVNALEIVGETGAGRDKVAEGGTGAAIGGDGGDPQIMVQYSWDGKPFSNEVWRPWGKIGRPETKAKFGPCGSGRDFVLRVSCSEPIRFVITGGWADVAVGS